MLPKDLELILLKNRGITDEKDVEKFLKPNYEASLHDPFLLPDMDLAVLRILEAIEKNEKIVVYSDYDADGIPGAVILHDFFKAIKYENVSFYIPHRHDEGYGLHMDAIEEFGNTQVNLIITIDLGTTAVKEAIRAKELGIDIVITDHHLPHGEFPEVVAFVNPHREDSKYPEKILCGAGVAFKLACAILQKKEDRWGLPEGYEKWWLDMVAIATLSDMVPLLGENRALAYFGLKVLRKSRRPGLRALIDLSGTKLEKLTEDDVGFTIAPRINVASRLDDPHLAFQMLKDTSALSANPSAIKLNDINTKRKTLVATIMKEVHKKIKKDDKDGLPKVIVVGNPAWHVGVLGLVASKICESYGKPSFVWGEGGDGNLRGSCRSDGTVNLVALMDLAGEHFLNFGGHEGAGGFTVSRTSIHTLSDELSMHYETISVEKNGKNVSYEAELALADVNPNNYEAITLLAPYGVGNPKPVFCFKNVIPKTVRQFGKTKEHLEVIFTDESGIEKKAIAFFATAFDFTQKIEEGITCNLIATFDSSDFGGKHELRLKIVDVH